MRDNKEDGQAMSDIKEPEEKLGLMLQILSNFIKNKLEKK